VKPGFWSSDIADDGEEDYIPRHEPSRLESAAAAYADSQSGTPLNQIRYLAEHATSALRNDDVKSAEELNAKYTDVENPFTAPASEKLAQSVNERGRRRRMLQEVVAQGPQDWTQTAVNFVAGMAPQIVDPINYLAGVGVDAGISRTMGHLLKSGKISPGAWGKAYDLGIQGPVAKFGTTVASNVVGNVAQEMTLTQGVMELEKQDFDVEDHFLEAVAGGIAFPVILKGFGKGWDLLKQGRNAVDHSAKVLEAYEQQMAAGRVPDVTPMLQEVGQRNLPDMRKELEALKSEAPQARTLLEKLQEDPDADVEMVLRLQEDLESIDGGRGRIEELEALIKDAEELGAPDRVKAVEEFNDPNKTMYDPNGDGARELEEMQTSYVDDDPMMELEDTINTHIEDLDSAVKLGLLAPEEIVEFKQFKAEIDLNDEVLKAGIACSR